MLEDIPLNQDCQEYSFYSSFSVVVIALYHPVNQFLLTIISPLSGKCLVNGLKWSELVELFEYRGVSVVDHKLMKAGLGSTL